MKLIYTEDMVRLRESRQLFLAQGATMIYPAHGKTYEADIMRKALAG